MSAPEFDWSQFIRDAAVRAGDVKRSEGAEAARADARWVVEQEELARRLRDPARHQWQRFWKALMLAKDVETFEALLDGEKVPRSRLDPV